MPAPIIKPIPPETWRLAGLGMQREVEKIEHTVKQAERTFAPMMRALIATLGRL